jgi:replicative DNA helicase
VNEISYPQPLLGISLREPPANVEAEYSLLGAIMSNGKALNSVVGFLKPEHFAEPLNGRIYRECVRRILAGGVASPVLMREWFDADPDASTYGAGYIGQLVASMVSLIGVKDYGRAIYDCWQRRELIGLGEDLVNRSFGSDPGDGASALVTGMIDKLDAVAVGNASERRFVSMNEAMDAAIARAEKAANGEGGSGISTGMQSVDQALGGLEAQCLYIIAGRPGMGKSALGWMWAVHAAREAKRLGLPGVLVVSLEMSAEQLGRRALSAVAGIPLEAIKHGRLQQADWDRIVRARTELDSLPLSIEDCSNLSIGMVRLKARAAKRRHGLGLIMVDHLHIVRPEDADARNGGTWAIGKISNGMKQLAKEFECPVLALAQLNRQLEAREDKRPTLADLRQAGEIEQDADAVGFVYRGEYYLPKGEPERGARETQQQYVDRCFEMDERRQRLKGKAELILEKVRDGSPCSVHLNFDGATTHFTEPNQ